MEYSLKVTGKKTDQKWLSDLLKKKNLTSDYLRKHHNAYFIDEFCLSIGLNIIVYENVNPPGHPAYSYETMFLEHDFVYQETVSFELDKFNDDHQLGYRAMLEIVFAILESLKNEGVFYHTSGGEILYFKEGRYILNQSYLEFLEEYYGELLGGIDYSLL
ncbi:hypothetical protein [Cohnella fermenti]|uniref:Uncharacterized protein n=1 Tax=Cohnella fermenti TaxID=2565925 RepID=A0A4S4BHB9_9BACL|nr:hypothetical protein [Cohnella fermenti]THF73938.1 hypothetical protein E6C55_27095 [Cohnella fermenti]